MGVTMEGPPQPRGPGGAHWTRHPLSGSWLPLPRLPSPGPGPDERLDRVVPIVTEMSALYSPRTHPQLPAAQDAHDCGMWEV